MQHRNLCTSGMSEMDQHQAWNHLNSETHLQLENAAINGLNSAPYLNSIPRTNDYPSSSLSTEIPHYRVPTSGTSRDTYLHPSAAGSSSCIPSNYAQLGSSCYSTYTIHGDQDSTLNSQMDSGRGAFKRKTPAISMVYDGGNTSRYHSSGSPAIPISSDHLHQKPMPGSQCCPWDPNSMLPIYRGNNLLVNGEGYQRNVRCRHTDALHLESNLAGTHLSSNLPCHIHSTGDFPGSSMTRQWTHNPVSMVPHGGILSSDAGGFNNELNQSLLRSSISSGSVEIDGLYHHNPIPSRNSSAPLPVLHGPPTRGMGGGRISYGQTTVASRSMSSYPPLGSVSTSLESGGRLGPEAFSRRSRPLSVSGGHNYDRSGRVRNSYGRFQSLSDMDNSHGRWVSEGVVMMDRSTFYGSRNLYDQHGDMRLDIDNMSYEELLALEERIGNVNTGLSEDMILKCLTETIYCSLDQIQEGQEEEHCVICLEGYRDREELGTLKCGHEYHVGCIKNWLLIKNLCPICKAPAVKDTSKEKLFVSV